MRRDGETDPQLDDWLSEESPHDAPTLAERRGKGPPPPGGPFGSMQGRRAIAAVVVASIVVLVILIVALGGDDDAPQAVGSTGPTTDTTPLTDTGTAVETATASGPPLQLQGNGVLRAGASGPRVRQLQRALAQLGYEITPDGAYGPQTTEAVRRFQTDANLDADGIAGPATIQAINAELAGGG